MQHLGSDVLTTAQGEPGSDREITLKIRPRGPTPIEDFHFCEKRFHFDHEQIPERVVRARGYGAVADAFAHCTFIGYVAAAQPFLAKAGVADNFDEGCIALAGANDAASFIDARGKRRVFEPAMKMR